MGKFWRIICLSWLMIPMVWGQEKYIDSLKTLVTTTTPDTSEVNIYNRIFFHYIFFNLDSAYHYASLAYAVANKSKHQAGLSMYYNNVGVLQRIEGDYPEALENLLKSLKINESIQNQLGIGNNYVNIGLVYFAQKKYDIALEYYFKCLKIKQTIGDKIGTAYCMRDIADAYAEQKKYTQAIAYHEKVIAMQARPAITYGSIKSIGIIYHQQNKSELATDYLQRALQGMAIHDRFNTPPIYNHLGKIAEAQNKLEEAETHYQKALQIALQFKNRPEIKISYQNLANIFFKQHKVSVAYNYLQRYVQVQDSLFDIASTEKMARLQNNYELRKKQEEMALMAKDQLIQEGKFRWQSILIYALVVGGTLSYVIAIVLYINNRQKQKINLLLREQHAELAQKNEEIRFKNEEIQTLNENLEQKIDRRTHELQIAMDNVLEQNQDLEQFSYIVSHNMRAPVASILGLISILDKSKINDPEIIQIIDYLNESTEKLDTVFKDMDKILTIRTRLDKTREVLDLQALTQKIIENNLREDIKRTQAIIQTDFGALPELYSVKAYLQNILNNLLSNAIKFQAPHRPPRIFIQSFQDHKYQGFMVKDNGLGIDLQKVEPYKIFGLYQRMHTHVEGKGLGLYLVKTQVESLKGKIDVESELGKGSIFKVYFPIE
ncbi:MAG: tetratricopeptide repeat-containing sensor histidine kinase [Microscillaceae bacterium]|jgi:signal transduction histidine kinase|nr:tetratricopeptide repeat-containing sensor histidine kinase [Microscillaceae bacterium]